MKIYEYGDLQCPVCKEYSEEILPEVIENQVKKGEASITFRNFIIIGPQSIPAGEAALAAGAQDKGWSFIETWYRNQGEENSGYATDAFLKKIAGAIPGLDVNAALKARSSAKVKAQRGRRLGSASAGRLTASNTKARPAITSLPGLPICPSAPGACI